MPTALITGANRGIGLSLARALRRRGYDVIGTTRADAPELAEVARVERCDVASDAEVTALAERLAGVSIDLLVNNAGVLTRETLDDLDLERIRRQIEINAVAPLKLTHALRDHLAAGAKVAIVTSRMGSIGDNTSGRMYGYRMSKAAVNAAGVSLAHDLRPRGISVVLLHPGMVRTGMTGGHGDWDADEAAVALADRIEALTLERSGAFLHAKTGAPLPW